MLEIRRQRQKLLCSSAIALAITATSTNLSAQEEAEEEVREVEEVVVTGSRLKRTTFNSASPIQIISGEVSRDIGLFDTTEILQQSTQATGLQIDNTFNGFVLDGGTGATTIGLRGLGPERTLVLINGRRLASAGIGGAPGSPDLSLLPSVLVSSIETLLDGASAVYGSDAIAGVVNAKLRTDVQGFEVEGSARLTESGGGEEYTVGALYGDSGENWRFTLAGEFFDRSAQTFAQNPYFAGCNEVLFEDQQGNRLTENRSGISGSGLPGNGASSCRVSATNRIFEGTGVLGSIYYTPGSSNINIPNFSDTSIGIGLAGFLAPGSFALYDSDGDGVDDRAVLDGDGDGLTDVRFTDPRYNFNVSDTAQQAHFISSQRRVSLFFDGAYQLADENDTELFAEASYTKRETFVFNPGAQLFPTVSASNPFNPVGVDGADAFGAFPAFASGPTTAIPIFQLRGDRDTQDAEIELYRITAGVRGNIGLLDDFLGGGWSYEAYGSYSKSVGREVQTGLHSERLALSLDTTIEDPDSPGSFICGVDGDGDNVPDGTDGCVPVNVFADSIFQAGGGNFATQAEADYLFVERTFRTEVEQTIINASMQGDVFALPWNDQAVPFLLGFEYRDDAIDSIGNDIANDGLLENFFSDRGAVGSRQLYEVFAETSLNIAKDFVVDLSARVTDESNFDPAFTYSVKALYQPAEFVTFRGTYGTSYRAPNLRERFLLGTTGFTSFTDPCVVPADARITDITDPTAPQTYDPTGDTREAQTLGACSGSGVDPLSLGLDNGTGNGFNALTGVEVSSGGSENVGEEEGRTFTAGIVLRQPFTDKFDLELAVTYYDIRITGGINEPSTAFVVGQCYDNDEEPDGTSEFCGFLERDGATGQLEFINRPFVNVGLETSKGFDINALYRQDFEIGNDTLGVTLDVRATNTRERFFDILGNTDDNVGEITTPEWRATALLSLNYQDFRLNWSTRWIQGGIVDEPTDFDSNGTACPLVTDLCRPISSTPNYDVHTLSMTYTYDDAYTVNIGVRNIFDQAPPRVDGTDVFALNNNPLGVGYDTRGRSFFATVRAKF